MELRNPSNGELHGGTEPVETPSTNGDCLDSPLSPGFGEDYFDSACSTPFVSAPSSPGRGAPAAGGFFYSAPSSPMHFVLCPSPFSPCSSTPSSLSPATSTASFEFEFSARYPAASAAASAAGSMSSADELFLNGQIRPMKLSSHLERPQALAPLLDLSAEDDDRGDDAEKRETLNVAEVGLVRGRDLKLRSRSIHRRARSLSPLRNAAFFRRLEGRNREEETKRTDEKQAEAEARTPSAPASASRSSSSSSTSSSSSSSSSGRGFRRWIFLKDLLHRSKSEGRATTGGKEKFWHAISFSASKERSKPSQPPLPPSSTPIPPSPISDEEKKPAASPSKRPSPSVTSRPVNVVGRRRGAVPSAHERHYMANRAHAEEMRRRTYLPYRQGLLGCLGFSSRSYGAINGFARSLNHVSSR